MLSKVIIRYWKFVRTRVFPFSSNLDPFLVDVRMPEEW